MGREVGVHEAARYLTGSCTGHISITVVISTTVVSLVTKGTHTQNIYIYVNNAIIRQ